VSVYGAKDGDDVYEVREGIAADIRRMRNGQRVRSKARYLVLTRSSLLAFIDPPTASHTPSPPSTEAPSSMTRPLLPLSTHPLPQPPTDAPSSASVAGHESVWYDGWANELCRWEVADGRRERPPVPVPLPLGRPPDDDSWAMVVWQDARYSLLSSLFAAPSPFHSGRIPSPSIRAVGLLFASREEGIPWLRDMQTLAIRGGLSGERRGEHTGVEPRPPENWPAYRMRGLPDGWSDSIVLQFGPGTLFKWGVTLSMYRRLVLLVTVQHAMMMLPTMPRAA